MSLEGVSPTLLGRYRLVKLLATGGMGEVFLARQEGPAGFARPVVIKRILAHLAREPGFEQMFLEEARLAAVLSHPNVVQIFELGQADGTWFIAMEYLDGRSVGELREQARQKGEPVNPVQAARILGQALQGLHYAHTAKSETGEPLHLVHRDVSPDNVFVGFNGVVKVLDFGIAKASSAVTTTRAGELKGKFAYMSPEHLRGEPLDARSDVFAAGVVLYEFLCGERPFAAASEPALFSLILNQPPAPLGPRAPLAPAQLCAVTMKALEKDPAERFQSAEEFSDALESFVAWVGEPNTNASTAAYMKLLFGTPALDTLVPPAAPLKLSSAQIVLEPVTQRELAAPTFERAVPKPGAQAAEPSLAAGPEPEAQLELARPGPESEPEERLELARPIVEPQADEAAPAPARRRGWVLALAAVAALGGVAVLVGVAARSSKAMQIVTHTLTVTSEPSGASLRIGDTQVGKTPWAGTNLWTGEVPYELSVPGRQSVRGTFHGGAEVELNVKLPKK